MHSVKVAYLSLASRCLKNTICKRRYRECLNSWLVLTEKKLESKRSNRISVSVAHRLKSEVFNQWYILAVARESQRTSFKYSHFHAWLQYLGHKKTKYNNFLKASKHSRLKFYQRGISGLSKYLFILKLKLMKFKLTINLHGRYRTKISLRKLLRNAQIKSTIRKTERTYHYWKHISYTDNSRKSTTSTSSEYNDIVDPNNYTRDDSNIKRIHKMRLFSNWKKFIRTNLLKKIRLLIRRWFIYTIRRKKVTIAATTKFSDTAKKIRKVIFFQHLLEKVNLIKSWKRKINRWVKPLTRINKIMRYTMLFTRFRLWFLATGPARIVESKRIVRKRFRIWKNGYYSYAFYRYVLLKKVSIYIYILLSSNILIFYANIMLILVLSRVKEI